MSTKNSKQMKNLKKQAVEDAVTDGRIRRGRVSREARRATILTSALEVFAEHGYHQTSVTDLVKAAGVARGTFYLYFESKDAIFIELLEGLVQRVRSGIVGVRPEASAPPLEVQLQQTIARLLTILWENRPLTKIIFREAVGLHAQVDEKLLAFHRELYTYTEAALTLGEATGYTRAVDGPIVATAVVGAVRELVERYLVMDQDLDVEQASASLVNFVLYGVSVKAG